MSKFYMHVRYVYLPYAVEDIPIWKYPNVNVGHQDVMEASFLLVSEEGVWHPNFFGVSHC